MAKDTFEGADNALVIDLTAVEAMDSSPVDAGSYEATITGCEPKLSKSSGQPMWALEYTITSEGKFNGRKCFDNMSFSEAALPMTVGRLMLLKPDLVTATFNYQEAAPEMMSLQVKIVTKLEEYEGDMKTKIKSVKPMAAAGGFMEG